MHCTCNPTKPTFKTYVTHPFLHKPTSLTHRNTHHQSIYLHHHPNHSSFPNHSLLNISTPPHQLSPPLESISHTPPTPNPHSITPFTPSISIFKTDQSTSHGLRSNHEASYNKSTPIKPTTNKATINTITKYVFRHKTHLQSILL